MKLITIGDIVDTYIRIKQKGISSILNKIGFNNKIKRVKNNWNESKNIGGFWCIPFFIHYWNKVITGDSNINYPEYFCKKYLQNNEYTLLSIGSGTGFYEREFARQECFSKIVGIELSENRIKEANKLALKNDFNIKYLNENFYDIDFKNERFDVILFNSSLHHFENIEIFLSKHIKPLLSKNGYIVICDYIGKNRLYVPNFQLDEINKLIKIIPKEYRKYAKISNYKNKVYSPGLIRMKLSDPSEASDSEAILPSLHKYFNVLEEKQLGMNLIMPLMRGISHNFIDDNNEIKQILNTLLSADINFVNKYNISDFIFGVYQ